MNIKFLLTKSIIGLIAVFSFNSINAQKEYEVACIGFYNLENLFDTLVDPNPDLILQEDFTPEGKKNWNSWKYKEKMGNMAKVISELGLESTPDGAAVLGVCEIENRSVLEDLVKEDAIKDRNYQIVHYDSPDYRGIDVGFLYQPKYFKVTSSKSYTLKMDDNPKFTTRDELLVTGELLGERIHFIVNHWSSRRGGEKASSPKREAAAALALSIMDSIRKAEPGAKIILMGDLNDDPKSKSIAKVLKPQTKIEKVTDGDLYNPMAVLHNKGIGTLAHRDIWSLFDQMIMTSALIDQSKKFETFGYYNVKVFNKDYLINKEGNFDGYPYRTYGGPNYLGGYSDHFPVYLFLLREKK